jgi:hypothetical protein
MGSEGEKWSGQKKGRSEWLEPLESSLRNAKNGKCKERGPD